MLFVYLLDYATGTGLRYMYFKPTEGKFHDLTYALDSTRADLIIVGSSRASHGYVSQQIEDSLHLSCYNAGMEGAQFLHQYATVQSIIKRHKPKIIIWDYWKGLEQNELYYLELTSLAPYYFSHPEIKEIIDHTRPHEKYKMLCKVYPFNSTLFYNINKVLNIYKSAEKDRSAKGWIPLRRTWTEPLEHITAPAITLPLDTTCVKYLRATMNYCKQNNIKLFIVLSPYFAAYKNQANYDVAVEELAKIENTPLLNFFADSTLLATPKYFAEPKHLNDQGAQIFTAKLIQAIKKTDIK